MLNSKQNSDKNTLNLQDRVPIVKKVLVGETLKNIKPGKTAHFSRRELGNRDNTVQLDDSVRTRETFYNNRTLVVRLFGMPVFKLHRSLVNEHVPKIQKCLEPCDHHQD